MMQANGSPVRPVGVDRMPKAPQRSFNSPTQRQRSFQKSVDITPQLSAEQILTQRLTERMLASISSDPALRDLIRKGLSQVDADDLLTAPTDAETTSPPLSIVEDEDHSYSGMSDLSSVSGMSDVTSFAGKGIKARMDIWHPDFWDAAVDDSESTISESTVMIPTSSETSSNERQQQSSESESSNGTPIRDFLRERNKPSGMISYSLPNDETFAADASFSVVSHYSDITAFTGVAFEDLTPVPPTRATTRLPSVSRHSALADSEQPRSLKTNRPRLVNNTVRFHEVNVRLYERIMCDNPACRSGPSVGLGWNYVQKNAVGVDEWEERRSLSRKSCLVLDRSRREDMIRSLGYSDREIAAVVRELSRIRYHRQQTLNNRGLEQIEMTVENARRNVKKLILGPLRK